MSYMDMNPSPPQDTTFSVPENRTLSSDDNNNNALLRGDNHTDCDRLRHIIKEPGPNNNSHNTRETNTLTDGINLTCNVHSSQGDTAVGYFATTELHTQHAGRTDTMVCAYGTGERMG